MQQLVLKAPYTLHTATGFATSFPKSCPYLNQLKKACYSTVVKKVVVRMDNNNHYLVSVYSMGPLR